MDLSDDTLAGMEQVARDAGALLLRYFRRPLAVSYKGVANLITEADTASEHLIRERLAPIVPDAAFLGEESGGELSLSGMSWVVDPLDGTTNFAHGFPWFSVSIALVEHGVPVRGVVYHPVLDELYAATAEAGAFRNGVPISVSTTGSLVDALLTTGFYYHKGGELARQIALFERAHQRVQTIRRPGSAALDLAYVAAGHFEAFWEQGLSPWDVAAGYLLVQEAGGRVSDYAGRPVRIGEGETLASNGYLHDEMVVLLRGVRGSTSPAAPSL
ncbi:MAG: inositol monophosphatase [Candidatus Eisenbacteria bacterium]|nr:inositol monophosphatase [Candidatus Eisenbacteria bacterium]